MNFSGKIAEGYVRTSSEANPAESIPNQVRQIQDYCASQGIILQEVLVDEAETGVLSANRDNYLKLKSLIKHKAIDIVVVNFASRFGRSMDEWIVTVEETKKAGIEFISITEGLIGSEMNAMQVAMAGVSVQLENENRRRACDDGLRNAKAAGKFVNSTPPFGYRKDENKYLVLYEPEAIQVRLINELALARHNGAEIAKILNERGFRKASGAEWHSGHIYKILRNRTYCGIIHHLGERVKEPFSNERIRCTPIPATTRRHPAIISEDTFEKVNLLLSAKPKISKSIKIHLLSRILYCPECGARMIADDRNNRYVCNNHRKGISQCVGLKIGDIEPKVLDYLAQKQKDNCHSFDVADDVNVSEDKERDELLAARRKLNMKFVNLQMSAEVYQSEVHAINVKIQEITLCQKKYDIFNTDCNDYQHLINDHKALNKKLRKDGMKFSLNKDKEVIQLLAVNPT